MGEVKKILFVANVHWFFLHFQLPYLKWLSEMGHEVHVAANSSEQVPFVSWQFSFSIQRSPFSWKNIKAYFELKKIIRDNEYDLIHCHTPMGGVLARLAARSFRKKDGLKVLYTAHGFHFYKGAPLLYWLLYYPMEKYLSKFTDALITINKEDFESTGKLGFKNGKLFTIKGVGVNQDKFRPVGRERKIQIRQEYGYSGNTFLMVYAAELIPRKNHRFIIDALPQLSKQIPDLKVIFAGVGELEKETKAYAKKKKLLNFIDFVGYRTDLEKWMAMADAGISSSKMEGLGLNVAEAMFCGIPVVVTRIRGHNELVTHGANGLLFEAVNREEFERCILDLYHSPDLQKQLATKGLETVLPFGIENVKKYMTDIYQLYL